jgi:hypothetical protein
VRIYQIRTIAFQKAHNFRRKNQMTSWIRANPQRTTTVERALFFETTVSGICANFNQFLYAYAYAETEGKPLTVYDMNNSISPSFPLIKNSFADMSGAVFVDSMPAIATSVRRIMPRVMEKVQALPMDTLRATAQRIFKWNPRILPQAREIYEKASLPAAFDLGIHIRAGDKITTREMTAISIDKYVAATKKYQEDSGLDELHIFIMTDTIPLRAAFIKKADPSWKIYYLPTPLPQPEGHIQAVFNGSPQRLKMPAYTYFMAELIIMQSIPDILCTLSSNVGRFLYYTVDHSDGIMSLDAKMTVV